MAGDTQNYVYDKIEQTVAEMQSFSRSIKQQAEQLTSQVTRLVDNGSWTGTAAEDYRTRAHRLTGKLDTNATTMDQTGKAVSDGAERMKQADSKGGAQMQG